MAPFSSFAQVSWETAPTSLSRFSGLSAYEIQGQAAPGVSSGEAMDRIAALAAKLPGTTVAWSGLSYQAQISSGQGPLPRSEEHTSEIQALMSISYSDFSLQKKQPRI